MGIKSTVTLPRSRALEMYHELTCTSKLSNYELGNLFDELVEQKCEREGRTCFDNFVVVDDEDDRA